jgi:hypothetical protein
MDKHYYIFTNPEGTEILLVKECPGMGNEAAQIRRDLSEELQMPVVAWANMGGDNPDPRI